MGELSPHSLTPPSADDPFQVGVSALNTKSEEHVQAVGPLSEEELTIAIARLFAQELGMAEIDGDAHFLFLGADSLNVERVMAAIIGLFSVDLSTATILDAPTPRALARMIAPLLSSATE